MREFKRNTEKKDLTPTKEQIQRQKDFSRLHHDYERLTKRSKKPLYRDPKLLMLLIILGIVMLLIFLESK